jgi:bis(5'-nucleosyl)-tetraphosphatase (symmetrical)
MAVYAIGDVQGCYSELLRLLDKIKFDPANDSLWFCGDMVNRGPESLQTLRFIKSLGDQAVSVLGNHDMHLLALYHGKQKLDKSDTLSQVLTSPDCDELMAWLQTRPLAHYDSSLKTIMMHAGVHPNWNLEQTLARSLELEQMLQGGESHLFFEKMYGDSPDLWSDDLTGLDRLRCITNVFTRMRFLTPDCRLDFAAKGAPEQHKDSDLTAWYQVNGQLDSSVKVVFGHWATLATGQYGRHFATDSGCVWGQCLTALQIDTTEPCWHSINCHK